MDESYLIKADKDSTAQYLKTLVDSGIITRNEARKQLGYNEMDGCDDLIVPFTNIKDNTIGNQQENSEKESESENKNNINIKDE